MAQHVRQPQSEVCLLAAKRLYEANKNPHDREWDELPINNQRMQVEAVARFTSAYFEAYAELAEEKFGGK